jgi:pimeloyl-ACP methyl ester carboxylesterase
MAPYPRPVPSFASYDGTELVCRVLGEPGEPLVCLPGGPLRASRYLGDLGGLDEHYELVMPELPRRRVDRIVPDLEALRIHLGREQLDILAHSAAGNLALLYASAHPDRVGRLVLVTPGLRVVGIDTSEDEFRAALGRRSSEPWYPGALSAIEAWESGDDSPENRLGAAPFFYGRWDAAAQAHAAGEADEIMPNAFATYFADGAIDVPTNRAGLGRMTADVLVVVGENDFQPTVRSANELAQLIPRATVAVQPGAGHFPWLDDPAAFVSIVTGFLDR